jgi:hypothetical protein
MRLLRPDSMGKIVQVKPEVKMGGNVTPYSRPSPVLNHMDRVRQGESPKLCITRKQGGIGDVLMTLPTVKGLSKKYNVKIDYGTDYNYMGGALHKVLEGNPYIGKVMPWRDVDPEAYNCVLDLTCPCVAYEKPLVPPINRIDLFARHIGLDLEDHNIDYYIKPEEIEWAKDFITTHNLDIHKRILVNPSSSTTRRDCPRDKMKGALAGILAKRRDIRPIARLTGISQRLL